ncbi:unnamed protein product [Ceratitis capitata]|uniref:(Mediterranean fruit fly) hypothetical protein n=1 Tax=Ceratitis capitata TaxID=7213 RepID=A0A811UIK0_CERCA|nr:unnamed protein product [Ceratitis capitata]
MEFNDSRLSCRSTMRANLNYSTYRRWRNARRVEGGGLQVQAKRYNSAWLSQISIEYFVSSYNFNGKTSARETAIKLFNCKEIWEQNKLIVNSFKSLSADCDRKHIPAYKTDVVRGTFAAAGNEDGGNNETQPEAYESGYYFSVHISNTYVAVYVYPRQAHN